MGFTGTEKKALKAICRDKAEVDRALSRFPETILDFIRSSGLSNQISDYGRFPHMKHRITKAENVEICLVFDENLDIGDILDEMSYFLTPPYRLHVDCSFIMKNPEGES